MRPYRGTLGGVVLLVLTAAQPASAAWNNVFQVCCNSCGKHQSASPIVTSGTADPCPQKQCTTRYHQRSYYQPVTTYRQSCKLEPVTTYRTSYYYEPVTSYRYSCYYDPCTCSYKRTCKPVTSYRLRSRCCPVTSYLRRCCLQPQTTYRKVNYWVPQTTCCETTMGQPTYTPPAAAATIAPPTVNEGSTGQSLPSAPPPSVRENSMIPPSIPEGSGSSFNRTMPKVQGNSFKQPQLSAPERAAPVPERKVQVRPERITSFSRGGNVQGQLVGRNQRPSVDTQMMFVHADKHGMKQLITTDESGRFRVSLSAGSWLVYIPGEGGKPVFKQKIYVMGEDPQMILVSR